MKSIKKAARRAFSLVEMVIVLVVAGLLAAIAVAGFSSVVDRAEAQTATQSLRNIEAEYRAMDAFNAPNFGEGVDMADMTAFPSNIVHDDADGEGDLDEGETLTATLGDGSTIVLTLGNATVAGGIA